MVSFRGIWVSRIRIRMSEVQIRIQPFSRKSVERTEILLAKLNFNTKFFLLKI
jgi:uncharacterized lipoprotein YddW (UPF0748 family)